MIIDGYEIKPGCRPYIIAEISCNHTGSIEKAFELIKAAKAAGADAVKFQCYTPDTITLRCNKPDFIVQDGIWKGRTLYDLYSAAYTPFEWFPRLFAEAVRHKVTAFASVFDNSSIELLDKLGAPAFKIASFEISDVALILMAAATKKPLIISTGTAKNKEVLEAKTAAGGMACFLHCTSEYPGTIETSDLSRIERLRQLLGPDSLVGLSDHTPASDIIPAAATALGAVMIEKHLMLPGDSTEDDQFSLTPKAFKRMVDAVNATWAALQVTKERPNPSVQFRRSLYAVADIDEGDVFTSDNVRSIRPGYGLPPRELPKLLGKEANKCYRRGDRIT